MPLSEEQQRILDKVVADLLPTTATAAERFAFAAVLVEAADRFLVEQLVEDVRRGPL